MTLQKKVIWGFGLIGALTVIIAFASDNAATIKGVKSSNTASVVNTVISVNRTTNTAPATITNFPTHYAAPNGYYQNTYGNEVPRPYVAPSVPAGASAKCRDGSYSFSQSRRGTCSHHGGVSFWY